MNARKNTVLTAAIAASVLLAACGGAAAPASTAAPQVVEKTVVVTSAPIEKTVVSVVTATPDPNAAAKPTDPPGSVQLNASGATFPQPLYEDWAFAYNQIDPSVVINYGGGGSGQGIKDIKAGNVDFAGSDALLKDADYQEKPGLQMLPTVAGAVVLAYNIKGITASITLNSDVVAGIYLGKIEKWSDPAIATLNPSIKFPDAPINVVHRSDGSGTTNIFTLYLSAISEDWKKGPGAGTAVDWPVDKLKRGQGGKGNPGVAAAIQNTDGAIGYVELAYAKNNSILFAKLVNASGKTVEASIPSTVAAIKDAQFSDKLTAIIVNSKQADAWPIAGFTYLIVNKNYQDCKKAEKLIGFINWALTDQGATARAAKLLYAPLPTDVTPKVIDTAKAITCQGKPVQP
jgi:phosphate transport system substrate-binding protein